MNSAWINLKTTYYLGKILGLFPFAGNHVFFSSIYSLILWILVCITIVYISFLTYIYTKTIPSQHKTLINVITMRVFFKFILAIMSAAISAQRSKSFFKLIDKFYRFDKFTLQMQCPSNQKLQTLYLLYAFSIEVYYLLISVYNSDVSVAILILWTLASTSTMLMIIQYTVFVRIIKDRYKLANQIFSSNINVSSICTRFMKPKEIVCLYNDLRSLTEEVKNYYAYHTILTIIDSVLIFVSCVTSLTLNYTNKIDLTLFHNKLFFAYCVFKLIFLFVLVRETHNTVQETHKTVLIAHEALSIAPNTSTMKEIEVLIMTCWNHPIVFDVYDFFDLDYNLLQSIIASVVTYVVVLVQIQLAISEPI